MKVVDKINKASKTLFSFELLPPLKGQHFANIQALIDPLLEFDPAYINVTYHQEEVSYKKHERGLLEKKTIRKRPGTVGITAAIQYNYNVEVVPHIICGGFSKEDTENALIDLNFLDIKNLLVVRGDAELSQKVFIPEEDGHANAIDLVKQIVKLNKGQYIDEELRNTASTDFCIGVAGYPEKHIEAPNMESDLKYLKEKIDSGAEYIVTQMFFDNSKYFSFVEHCRKEGINVPIIPGLKPISAKNQIHTLPQTFNIDIPNDLSVEVDKCDKNSDARQVGVEWAIKQSKELLEFGVPALHFFTMGRSDNVQKIAKAVF